MKKATHFQFHSYTFEPKQKRVRFNYRIFFENAKPLTFTEELQLPRVVETKRLPQRLLENTLESLHLMLGISYYKLYCPGKVKLPYKLTKQQANFWNTVYRKGLGEFFYQNHLDPKKSSPIFPSSKKRADSFDLKQTDRALVGIGGGKDSIVSAELLKEGEQAFHSFIVETQRPSSIIEGVVKQIGNQKVKMKRLLDPLLFEKHPDSYNGHVPISASIAFIGYLSALLYDFAFVIVGNEFSSNSGNTIHRGEIINHQWSKTSEFEELFQAYCRHCLSPDITYFSLLRSFHEIRIAKMFAQRKEYHHLFTSCNHSFRVHKPLDRYHWCGECPKCAFVFLMLAAFLSKKDLIGIFHKDLLMDTSLLSTYRDLLGFGKIKPFECVGTFEESQAALYLARNKWKHSPVIQEYVEKIHQPEKIVKEVMKTHQTSTIPTGFQLLGMEKVVLLGYGKEGKATHDYLKKQYPNIKIHIADQAKDPHYLLNQDQYDFAIRTPGLHKDKVTIPYTTATNLFFSQVKDYLTIGVTGTKGKSTTSSLIYAILKEAGKSVVLGGNIGIPILSTLHTKHSKKTIFVIELSSYQLDDIDFSPHIAVVTNLAPEHMDYHGSKEDYYAAKQNILHHQKTSDLFFYQPKDERLCTWAKISRATVIPFAQEIPVKQEQIPLLGEHNRENIKAAVAVARHLGIKETVIARAIQSFKALPHRLQKVGTYRGVTFYDDAIATTPEATMEALKSLPEVETLFLGGKDRGYDFTALEKMLHVRGVKNIVLFPESGKRMLKSKKCFEQVMLTESMHSAVQFAYKHTSKGKICLLSCASPSYSLWKNFEEKGEEFQKEIKKQGR